VLRVDRDGAGWSVTTAPSDQPGETSTRWAEAVVLATGYSRVPFIPDWPGRDRYRQPMIHSAAYRNAQGYAGQQVLVVGVGNSAAEIAAELVEGGATVQLSVRTPPNIVRRSTLGVPSQLVGLSMKRAPEVVMNPASALLRKVSVPDLSNHGLPAPAGGFTQFLRTRTVPVLDHGFVDHVRAGRITVVAAVDHLSDDAVHLVDGSALRPDSVVCGTGFQPALELLVGHLGVLDERGLPLAHGEKTVPGAPGLHFVGITVELSGLLHEIGLEARGVGRALALPV
ncbi:MAG: NAD(P)/FAD-dependent oxidoreductase, partial [Propionibacteriaceae bacterium]